MTKRFEEQDWWIPLYDDIVADLFLRRHDSEVNNATTRFLIETLNLTAGSSVFDQCCGIGTHSLPMAQAGIQVLGVDQCESYIHEANQAVPHNFDAKYLTADAFTYVAPKPCDGGFNWNTGFGNDPDDQRNQDMLRKAYDSIRPGGVFVLDYQHVARILKDFQQVLTYRLTRSEGEILLLRESEIDLPGGLLKQRWTFILPNGSQRIRRTSVRLYLPAELVRLLQVVGFSDVQFVGGIDNQPLTLTSPRCIAIARRP